MELFFDTETSGFPSKKLPISDPDQPWIVQLGFILSDGKTIYQSGNLMIKANERYMSPGAQNVHGISVETADAYGLADIDVLTLFNRMMDKADIIIAHNYNFDAQLMHIAYTREGMELSSSVFREKPSFCTMLGTMDYCKLPGRYGKYKWPKLSELYMKLFDEEIVGAHDALTDVKATARCYYHLKNMGFFNEGEPHE